MSKGKGRTHKYDVTVMRKTFGVLKTYYNHLFGVLFRWDIVIHGVIDG